MNDSRILKWVELVVSIWIDNTPKFMQPMIGWKVYWKIADKFS